MMRLDDCRLPMASPYKICKTQRRRGALSIVSASGALAAVLLSTTISLASVCRKQSMSINPLTQFALGQNDGSTTSSPTTASDGDATIVAAAYECSTGWDEASCLSGGMAVLDEKTSTTPTTLCAWESRRGGYCHVNCRLLTANHLSSCGAIYPLCGVMANPSTTSTTSTTTASETAASSTPTSSSSSTSSSVCYTPSRCIQSVKEKSRDKCLQSPECYWEYSQHWDSTDGECLANCTAYTAEECWTIVPGASSFRCDVVGSTSNGCETVADPNGTTLPSMVPCHTRTEQVGCEKSSQCQWFAAAEGGDVSVAVGICAVKCEALSASPAYCANAPVMCEWRTEEVDGEDGRLTTVSKCAQIETIPVCPLLLQSGYCPSTLCVLTIIEGVGTTCEGFVCEGFSAKTCPSPMCIVSTAKDGTSVCASAATTSAAADLDPSPTTTELVTRPLVTTAASAPPPSPTASPPALTTTTNPPRTAAPTVSPNEECSYYSTYDNDVRAMCTSAYKVCRLFEEQHSCIDGCPADSNPIECPSSYYCALESVTECVRCPVPLVQCWDLKCVESPTQCSCRTKGEVRCPTNAAMCVESLAMCPDALGVSYNTTSGNSSECDGRGLATCEDGTCAATLVDCPCPLDAPIRCTSDVRRCARHTRDCEFACPAAGTTGGGSGAVLGARVANPSTRCWDGSCGVGAVSCPCPPLRPVRCPFVAGDTGSTDGYGRCAASLSECPCPSGTLRCHGGNGCVRSCAGSQLCNNTCTDGSCRMEVSDEGTTLWYGGISASSSSSSDDEQHHYQCQCTATAATAAPIHVAINATNPQYKVQAHMDLRLLGSVSYSECGVDMSTHVNLTWSLFDVKGREVTLAGNRYSSTFFLPAYTLPISSETVQQYRLVLTGIYTPKARTIHDRKTGIWRPTSTVRKFTTTTIFLEVDPSPNTIKFVGGSLLRTMANQPIDVALELRRPCTGSDLCATQGSGLRPYSCFGRDDCDTSFVVTCTMTASANGAFGSCPKMLTATRTLYSGVAFSMAGTYTIRAVFGSVKAEQIVEVIAPAAYTFDGDAIPPPAVTIRCEGVYVTEDLVCAVVTNVRLRGRIIRWYVDDVEQTAEKNSAEFIVNASNRDGISSVRVSVYDPATGLTNFATHDGGSQYASVSCWRREIGTVEASSGSTTGGNSGIAGGGFIGIGLAGNALVGSSTTSSSSSNPSITAIGLQTRIHVSCNVVVVSSTPHTAFSYRMVPSSRGSGSSSSGNTATNSLEISLSPFPMAGHSMDFVVPPLNGAIEIVARVWADGRVIATHVVGRNDKTGVTSPITISYAPSTQSQYDQQLSALLADLETARLTNDMTAAVGSISLLVIASGVGSTTSSTNPSISDETFASLVCTIVNAVAYLSANSETIPPSFTGGGKEATVSPMSASQTVTIAHALAAVLTDSRSNLTTDDTATASAVLAKLSRIASLEGGEDLQQALLRVVLLLGDGNNHSETMINSIALGVMQLRATLGGDSVAISASASSSSSSSTGGGSSGNSGGADTITVAGARFVASDVAGRSVSVGGSMAKLGDAFAYGGTPNPTVIGGLQGAVMPTTFGNTIEVSTSTTAATTSSTLPDTKSDDNLFVKGAFVHSVESADGAAAAAEDITISGGAAAADASKSTAANTTTTLTRVSDVVQFSLVFDGQQYPLYDTSASPVSLRIKVNAAAAAGAHTTTRNHALYYWDAGLLQWATGGLVTLGPCGEDGVVVEYPSTITTTTSAPSSGGSVPSSSSPSYICGTTTHFTTFAVFAVTEADKAALSNGSDDDSYGDLPIIMGAVVAGVVFLAVLTVIGVKVTAARREKRLLKKMEEEGDNNFNASMFDMSGRGDDANASGYEMRLLPPPTYSTPPVTISQTAPASSVTW